VCTPFVLLACWCSSPVHGCDALRQAPSSLQQELHALGSADMHSFCCRCREDALLLLQRPLSMQLELLHLWHEALSAQLASFAHQFRGAGGRVLLAADRAGFSVAAESCSYEGPLRLEVSQLPYAACLRWLWCWWNSVAGPTLVLEGAMH
jgi:hypothetical protein